MRLSKSSFQKIFRCGRSSGEVVSKISTTRRLAIESRTGVDARGIFRLVKA